ncbi:type II secretion system protein [Desulfovulcanus sp.]
MMNKIVVIDKDNGFSLLEMIVAIVVAGILGVIIVQFVQTSALKSVSPVTLLKEQYDIQSQVEDMTSYYREQLAQGSLDLSAFKDYVTENYENVDQSQTGFIVFSSNGNDFVASSTSSGQVLKVVLKSDDQTIIVLFTE